MNAQAKLRKLQEQLEESEMRVAMAERRANQQVQTLQLQEKNGFNPRMRSTSFVRETSAFNEVSSTNHFATPRRSRRGKYLTGDSEDREFSASVNGTTHDSMIA